jgi:type I restriction enzyme S subunit
VSELPRGWQLATIGEITQPAIESNGPKLEVFTYVDISSIDNARKVIAQPKLLEAASAPGRARQNIQHNDVLVSLTRPNLNAVAIVGPEHDGSVASTGFQVLRALQVDPRWIYYFVQSQSFIGAMSRRVQGVLYPAIRPSDLLPHPIPVAPLAEQQRIVAEIERHATIADVATQTAETALIHLDVLRRTALHRTFERADYDAIPLGDLIEIGPQNGLYKTSSAYGSGTPIVRIGDFQDTFLRSLGDLKQVRASAQEQGVYGLRANDLVINRVNSMTHLGKAFVVPPQFEGALFESNMMRLAVSPRILPRWVSLYLKSPEGRRRLIRNAKHAVNQASINQRDVCSTPVPLPTIRHQREQLDRLEAQLSRISDMRSGLQVALRRTTVLRQAILKKAFSGQLVPHDPNDEPASVLLDRIRFERTRFAPAPRPRQTGSKVGA